MAITLTTRLSDEYNGASAQTATTPSFTPTANSELFIAVFVIGNGLDTVHTSNTGGLTFTRLAHIEQSPGTVFGANIALFHASVGPSPSAMTVTFDVDSDSASAGWRWFGAFDAVGSVGTPTLVTGQVVAKAELDGGGNAEAHTTASLPATASLGNTSVLIMGRNNDGNGAATTPTGWTALFSNIQQFSSGACWHRTDFTGTSETITDLGQTIGCSATVLFELEEAGATPLTVDDASHLHTADSLLLTQHHLLGVNDASHLHTADSLLLTQAHVLSVEDTLHLHTADSLVLAQHHALTVEDASHLHTADSLVLTQTHVLDVNDALHLHTADHLSLSGSLALTVADALHLHTTDSILLVQHHILTVDDALHLHTADHLSLAGSSILTVDDALHLHTADGLLLVQHHVLSVEDALHLHTADSLALTQAHTLTVEDASHLHTADHIILVDSSGFPLGELRGVRLPETFTALRRGPSIVVLRRGTNLTARRIS